jgi:hypothetical protein
VTELEILRRRRELVLLSAQLQRATVVRRLDNVNRHPIQAVMALVSSAAALPLLFKVGSMAFGMARGRKKRVRAGARRGRFSLIAKLLPVLRFVPVLKMFPVLKFLNRVSHS